MIKPVFIALKLTLNRCCVIIYLSLEENEKNNKLLAFDVRNKNNNNTSIFDFCWLINNCSLISELFCLQFWVFQNTLNLFKLFVATIKIGIKKFKIENANC